MSLLRARVSDDSGGPQVHRPPPLFAAVAFIVYKSPDVDLLAALGVGSAVDVAPVRMTAVACGL